MKLVRTVLFGCLTAAWLVFTPAALADHWQKSSDGYWYYWSDKIYAGSTRMASSGRLIKMVSGPIQPPAVQSTTYQSYYYQPDTYYDDGSYGGYYGGYDGYWDRPGLYFGGEGGWGGRGWGGGRGGFGGGRGGRR